MSASDPESSKLLVAAIPSDRPGLRYNHDWENIGHVRPTAAASSSRTWRCTIRKFFALRARSAAPFASLRPCIAQLVLANVYLGIGQGALEVAKGYTHTQRRAWPASGVERASDDPYVLARYGEMRLELEGARLLADAAADALDRAWQRHEDVTAEERGEAALAIAAAKVAATRASLSVSSRIFEVMGARSTSAQVGPGSLLSQCSHAHASRSRGLQDKELGEWELNARLPVPSFYS